MSRCRICSANDEATLVEDVARAIWDTQKSSNLDDEWRPWDNAGPYWQRIIRQFAAAIVETLRTQHAASGQ